MDNKIEVSLSKYGEIIYKYKEESAVYNQNAFEIIKKDYKKINKKTDILLLHFLYKLNHSKKIDKDILKTIADQIKNQKIDSEHVVYNMKKPDDIEDKDFNKAKKFWRKIGYCAALSFSESDNMKDENGIADVLLNYDTIASSREKRKFAGQPTKELGEKSKRGLLGEENKILKNLNGYKMNVNENNNNYENFKTLKPEKDDYTFEKVLAKTERSSNKEAPLGENWNNLYEKWKVEFIKGIDARFQKKEEERTKKIEKMYEKYGDEVINQKKDEFEKAKGLRKEIFEREELQKFELAYRQVYNALKTTICRRLKTDGKPLDIEGILENVEHWGIIKENTLSNGTTEVDEATEKLEDGAKEFVKDLLKDKDSVKELFSFFAKSIKPEDLKHNETEFDKIEVYISKEQEEQEKKEEQEKQEEQEEVELPEGFRKEDIEEFAKQVMIKRDDEVIKHCPNWKYKIVYKRRKQGYLQKK